ncbi:MAG: carbon monoxide dehydrogenase [Rhodospirillales bacterium]|nr:carbon monoxide dehydrogenase [Rhodospirillales bacterium]
MNAPFVGQPIPRAEDVRFLTGRARFVDDLRPEGALHAVIARSPHAHARLLGVNKASVEGLRGVVGVIAADDIAHLSAEIPIRLAPLEGFHRFLQRPLASDRVRFVGEAVAMIVATSRHAAEDALERLEVEYEPLPAVVTYDAARKGAARLFPEAGTNVATRYTASMGDAAAAFARADLVIERHMTTHRHTALPLETRGLIAHEEADGILRCWGATKVTQWNRRALAVMLGRPEHSMDLIEVDVGGGFGVKGEFYPEDFLVPFAALRFGAPVKWIEDRREHLLTTNHSREMEATVGIAFARDGTMLGLRAKVSADMGAYVRTNGGVVPAKAAQFLPGPYRMKDVALEVEAVLTNKTPVGTLRGPGRYEAHFFRERLIDIAADELGLDPAEIRQRNLLRPEDMPWSIGNLVPYEPTSAIDSSDVPAAFDAVLNAIGYEELRKEVRKPQPDGRLRGIGLACFVESSGAGPSETARVELNSTGGLRIISGVSTQGQGHQTVLAQIAADAFDSGVPLADIELLNGTASLIEGGFGTYHSRAVVVGGSAIHLAARSLRAKVLRVAATRLQLRAEDLVLAEGHLRRESGVQSLATLAELHGWMREAGEAPDATETFKPDGRTYTCGAHAAHVAVDTETGQVEVLRYIASEDVGRAINPLMVHGQAIGAAVQGIGAAFLDELVYDENGQLLTGSLADYLVATASCFPHIEAITLENSPSTLNPLGAKGAGEGGVVACAAAIGNAIADALRPLGVEINHLPLGPDRLLRLIPEKPIHDSH